MQPFPNIMAGGASTPWGGTWDPSNKGADFTLSGGNLTATRASGGSHEFVRGTAARTTSGSFRFAPTVMQGTSPPPYPSIGLCNASALPGSQYLGNDANSIGLYGSGDINWNGVGSFISTGVTYNVTDVIEVVWAAGTTTVFWRKNGILIPGSAVNIAAMGATVYAAMGAFQPSAAGTADFT